MLLFQWLGTLDCKEIYGQVLDHLPDLQLLTGDTFQVRRATVHNTAPPRFRLRAPALDPDAVLGSAGRRAVHTERRVVTQLRGFLIEKKPM